MRASLAKRRPGCDPERSRQTALIGVYTTVYPDGAKLAEAMADFARPSEAPKPAGAGGFQLNSLNEVDGSVTHGLCQEHVGPSGGRR